jgi:hypothetical protein
MATQFVIPSTVKIEAHLKITIGLEKDSYSKLFEVKVEQYGMEVPKYFVKLFCLKQGEYGVWNGSINHRIYGSNINAFIDSFQKYCSTNITYSFITDACNNSYEIVYTFCINEILSGGISFEEYS